MKKVAVQIEAGIEVEPQWKQQDPKVKVNQYSTTQRMVLRVRNLTTIRRIKIYRFNKGPLEKHTSNRSNPGNPRNQNKNPKETKQSQRNTEKSKKQQIEIE